MVTMKTCSKCKETQPFSNFSKNKRMKDGFCNWCKECTKEQHRAYYKKNKEKMNTRSKEWRENNKEKMKSICADWYRRNCDKVREQHREYHRKNRDKILERIRVYNQRPEVKERRRQYQKDNYEHIKEYHREYRKNNIEYIRKRQREHYHANKEKHQKWHKKWRDTHKEQVKQSAKRYREENREQINKKAVERLHNDPIHKMKEQTRNMVRYALRVKGHRKTSRTADIVGCDLDTLCEHLFTTWEKNYGRPWNGEPYHIDHILPLATAKTEEDIVKLCHYTNLQLLTPEDNMAKSDKI